MLHVLCSRSWCCKSCNRGWCCTRCSRDTQQNGRSSRDMKSGGWVGGGGGAENVRKAMAESPPLALSTTSCCITLCSFVCCCSTPIFLHFSRTQPHHPAALPVVISPLRVNLQDTKEHMFAFRCISPLSDMRMLTTTLPTCLLSSSSGYQSTQLFTLPTFAPPPPLPLPHSE